MSVSESAVDEYLDVYEEQGFVVLEDFFDERLVERTREGIRNVVDEVARELIEEGYRDDPLEEEPLETRLLSLYEDTDAELPDPWFHNEVHAEQFYDLIFHDGLLNIAEEELGHELKLSPAYSIRFKTGKENDDAIWHQDASYFKDHEAIDMVCFWTPLVPVSKETGCLQFVPGSHRHDFQEHDWDGRWAGLDPEELGHSEDEFVDLEMDPGDVVMFDYLTLHQGQPPRERNLRWSLDWRYQKTSQPTGTPQYDIDGFPVRSERDPASVVSSAQEWAKLDGGE